MERSRAIWAHLVIQEIVEWRNVGFLDGIYMSTFDVWSMPQRGIRSATI
jgi:hypothetical protein